MVELSTIIDFIDDYLSPSDFDDGCVNGLQVEGKHGINKIVLGVSSSQQLFQRAIEESADLIIVHHGLFWKKQPLLSVTGILKQRLELLIKNDISLLGYHLPLDAHPKVGHNAEILSVLNLNQKEAVDAGFVGEYETPMAFNSFENLVKEKICETPFVLPYGSNEVKRVLVISGGSSGDYGLAKEVGADTFICGDMRENFVREIEETGLNVINAGHYNTEVFGIRALGELLEKVFNVPCVFIDIPNPV